MYVVTIYGQYGKNDREFRMLALDERDAAEGAVRLYRADEGDEIMVVKERSTNQQSVEVHFEYVNGELVSSGITA